MSSPPGWILPIKGNKIISKAANAGFSKEMCAQWNQDQKI